MMLSDSSVLITGATGSLGRRLIKTLLETHDVRRIVVYSRDELKQSQIASEYEMTDFSDRLRLFLGDVRDLGRLKRAMEGVDTVIHAAALKQVPAAEYNPMEFVKTNVLGAQNVVDAALDSGVRRVVALSTDKAAAPVNLYGATKLVSDKLFSSANNIRGPRDIRFSVVRYGNVLGSRGSVVPAFLQRAGSGFIPITDEAMTRFSITLDEGVDIVLWAVENALGGETFVPKIPSFRVTELARAIAPSAELKIVGIRPGEKLHEEMITESDSLSTFDIGKYFAILPSGNSVARDQYASIAGAAPVKRGFSYNSGSNSRFLSVEELQLLVRLHVDPNFQPV